MRGNKTQRIFKYFHHICSENPDGQNRKEDILKEIITFCISMKINIHKSLKKTIVSIKQIKENGI